MSHILTSLMLLGKFPDRPHLTTKDRFGGAFRKPYSKTYRSTHCFHLFIYIETVKSENAPDYYQGAKLLSFRVSGTPKNTAGNPISG